MKLPELSAAFLTAVGFLLPASTTAGTDHAIPQSTWSTNGAKPLPSRMKKHTEGITSVVIHHTESPNQTPAMERGRLMGIQRYHIDDRGWGDIAYHYLIGPSGKIYAGRDAAYQGDSGTNYDLDGRLLVCMIGNFTEQLPEKVAMSSLINFVSARLQEYKLSPSDVVTHRMVAATDCPGERLQQWFDDEGGNEVIANVFQGGKADRHLDALDFQKNPATTNAMKPREPEGDSTRGSGPVVPDGFEKIESLAVAPVTAGKKDIILNLRYRSPDKTTEFSVMLVKAARLGTGEYDRLITWKSIEDGERETTSDSEESGGPEAERVVSRFGISGPGNAYTRYFLRSYSTGTDVESYAILWEWMVSDSEAQQKWSQAYHDFKNSIDVPAIMRNNK